MHAENMCMCWLVFSTRIQSYSVSMLPFPPIVPLKILHIRNVLWSYSCLKFEKKNGHTIECVHRPKCQSHRTPFSLRSSISLCQPSRFTSSLHTHTNCPHNAHKIQPIVARELLCKAYDNHIHISI